MKYNQLKNIYRQGWLKVRIGLEHKDKCESVADHSFSVALLALTIIEKNHLNLDALKCIKMGIIHELGEVYAGDYTPFDNITLEEKHNKEKEAILNSYKIFFKTFNSDLQILIQSKKCGMYADGKTYREIANPANFKNGEIVKQFDSILPLFFAA